MLRLLSRDLVRSGFVRSPDGVHLYWRAVGQGPVLACCNGVGVSTFFWKYIVDHFRDRYTVLVWDYRGHGQSDRKLDPERTELSITRHADDLMLVLDAAIGPDSSAVLLGHSMGCQVALEAWDRHPDRVHGLILQQGTAGHVLDTFFDDPRSPVLIGIVRQMTRLSGRVSNLLVRPLLASPGAELVGRLTGLVDPHYCKDEDLRNYLKHMASLDQRLFMECVWAAQRHSAWHLLPRLKLPVLVLAAENDLFTPVSCSRRIAAAIPGAELLVLADASHAALIEQPETINCRVDRFLRERVFAPKHLSRVEQPSQGLGA